jgi:hypothetical protein
MSQKASQIKPHPAWVERLSSLVPTYAGYADTGQRHESERLYRCHLADRLVALKSPLDGLIRHLAKAGKVIEALPLERSQSKLDAVEKHIRSTDYGHSRFFGNAHVDEETLDLVYQYDLVLVEQARTLNEQINHLSSQSSNPNLLQAAEDFEATLVALEAEFVRRFELIINY